MIRVTVEIVPHGVESAARVIGRGIIANDGTGTNELGNYKYQFSQAKRVTAKGRSGELKNFPRARKNVWALIKECL